MRAEGARSGVAKRAAASAMTGSARVADGLVAWAFAVKAAASRRTPKKIFRLTLAGGNDSGSVEVWMRGERTANLLR